MKVSLTRIHMNTFNTKWLILLCFFKRRYILLLYEHLKFTNNHHSHKSHKESIFEQWRVHIFQGGYQICMLVLRARSVLICSFRGSEGTAFSWKWGLLQSNKFSKTDVSVSQVLCCIWRCRSWGQVPSRDVTVPQVLLEATSLLNHGRLWK